MIHDSKTARAEAELSQTLVAGANFAGAALVGADLRGVDLSEVRGLTRNQIHSALLDHLTRLPAYLGEDLN